MSCEHASAATGAPPHTPAWCEECVREGLPWVALRWCLTCGHVGCSDASPGRHARAHFQVTGHPVVRAYEPLATWGWCYVDEKPLDMGELLPHAIASPARW